METIINYYLPESALAAKIVFYDNSGRSIKEIDLQQKGSGSLTVNSSKLTSGAYSYSIVVNGKIVDTKKMMKVE